MMRKVIMVLICVVFIAGPAWAPAWAQEKGFYLDNKPAPPNPNYQPPASSTPQKKPAESSLSGRQGSVNAGLVFGALLDPDMPAVQLGADYYITDEVSVGPLLQFGMYDTDSLLGLSGQVKYSAALAGSDKIRPYGHVGIGFARIYDRRMPQNVNTTYLVPVGGGMEFGLTDKLSLDAGATFNISSNIYMGIFCGMRYLF